MKKERKKALEAYDHKLFDLNNELPMFHRNPKDVGRVVDRLISLADQVKTFAKEEDEPQAYQLAAKCYASAASYSHYSLDNPDKARRLYRYAEDMYKSAGASARITSNDIIPTSKKKAVGKLSVLVDSTGYQSDAGDMRRLADRARRNAAVYKLTQNMNPVRKWVIRKTKTIQPVILFLLSLIFLIPSITGNVIGNSSINISFGLLLFLLALIGFYLVIYKNKISK